MEFDFRPTIDAAPETVHTVWETIDAKIPAGEKDARYQTSDGKSTIALHRTSGEDEMRRGFFTVLGGFTQQGERTRIGYIFYEGGDPSRAFIAVTENPAQQGSLRLLSEPSAQQLRGELASLVA